MLLQEIARNPQSSPTLLAAIAASNPDPEVRKALTRNVNTPIDVIDRLGREDKKALIAYLDRGPLSAERALECAHHHRDRLVWLAALRACPTAEVARAALEASPKNTTLMWNILQVDGLPADVILELVRSVVGLLNARKKELLKSQCARLVTLAVRHPSIRQGIVDVAAHDTVTEGVAPYLNPSPALVAAQAPLVSTNEGFRQWMAAADRPYEQVEAACLAQANGAGLRSLIAEHYPHAGALAQAAVRRRPNDARTMTRIAGAQFLELDVRLAAAQRMPAVTRSWDQGARILKDLMKVAPGGWAHAELGRRLLTMPEHPAHGQNYAAAAVFELARQRSDWSSRALGAIDDLRFPDEPLYAMSARWVWLATQLNTPQIIREHALTNLEYATEQLRGNLLGVHEQRVEVARMGVRAGMVGVLEAVRQLPLSTMTRSDILEPAAAMVAQALNQVLPGLADEATQFIFVALAQDFAGTFGELVDSAADLAA